MRIKSNPTAPKAPKAVTPKVAIFSADIALQVATQFVALVVDTEGQSVTFIAKARLLAMAIGVPMTFADWDKLMKPVLLDAFKGSGVDDQRVSEYLSRFKVFGCAALTGDKTLDPQTGESRRVYQTRVNGLLASYKLADGRPMVAESTSGRSKSGTAKRGRKPGTPASNKGQTKNPQSASKADDAGHDVSRNHALCVSVMGNEADGKLLLAIASDAAHREAFRIWAKDRLAKAVDTTKAPKAPKAPAEEPDAKAVALNKAILAMANAKNKPKAKANGAAA